MTTVGEPRDDLHAHSFVRFERYVCRLATSVRTSARRHTATDQIDDVSRCREMCLDIEITIHATHIAAVRCCGCQSARKSALCGGCHRACLVRELRCEMCMVNHVPQPLGGGRCCANDAATDAEFCGRQRPALECREILSLKQYLHVSTKCL